MKADDGSPRQRTIATLVGALVKPGAHCARHCANQHSPKVVLARRRHHLGHHVNFQMTMKPDGRDIRSYVLEQ